jgi:Uncharacterized protein conserved in bacteria (DUF2125)
MSKMKSLSISLSTAALMAASPAFAEITATELWSMWQQQSADYGQALTAQVTETGSGLVLTNLSSSFAVEEVTLSTLIDQVTLTNQPDGTVAIGASDTLTYRITGIDDPDAPDEIAILFRQTGFSATASGSAEILTMTSVMQNLELEDITFIGIDPSDTPEIDATLALSGFAGSYIYDLSDPSQIGISGTSSTGGFNLVLGVSEPVGGGGGGDNGGGGFTPVQPQPQPTVPSKQSPDDRGRFDMALILGASESTFSGTFPADIDWMMTETYPAGLAVELDSTYESMSMRVAFQDRSQNFDFATENAGGNIGFGLSERAIRYELGAQGVTFNLSSNEVPFPMAAAADSTLMRFNVPLAREDQPSPFSAAIAYQGVTVDDGLWAMVDPGGQVPRGPATVIMDVSGTVQILVDLLTMDPDELARMSSPPGELRELTLNNLQVSFGGAELTGVGDLDFTPGQIIPVPVGSLELNLTGANGLIQTLSNAGLLPPEQAGMARGMLGMFAIPGSGPDSYTSSINFDANGGITANGVPLR